MTTPAADSPAAAPPIESTEDLKKAHIRLLELSEHADDSTRLGAGIIHFLEAGVALGSKLSVPRLRSEVQHLLDYWSSSLSIEQLEDSRRAGLRRFVLAPCAVDDQPKIVEAVGKAMAGLSPEVQQAAEIVVLRLVKLESDSASFSPVSRSQVELGSGLSAGTINEVIKQFVQCGLITEEGGKYALSSATIVGFWPDARTWLSRRRRLRGAAQFWNVHDRDAGALLEKGDALEEARLYLDLNPIEEAFVQTSIREADKREQHSRWVTRFWLIALSILCVSLTVSMEWAWQERNDAVSAKNEATLANGNLTKANTEIVKTNEKLGKANEDLANERAEIQKQNKQLAKNNTELLENAQKITALNSKLNEDNTRQNVALESLRSDLAQQQKTAQARLEALVASIRTIAGQQGIPKAYSKALVELTDQIGVKLDSPVAHAASAGTDELEPGAGLQIRSGKQISGGTIGFFVGLQGPNTSDGKAWFLGPRYLFNVPDGGAIYRVNRPGDTPGPADLIAHLAPSVASAGEDEIKELVAVEVVGELKVRNDVPSVGKLSGFLKAEDLALQSEVVLSGLGSGTKRGLIRRIDREKGMLFTDRISTAGDAGAPVVTPDGRAVGILVASNGKDESQIALLSTFLSRNSQYRFLTDANPPQADSAFNGAIVQLIVSETLNSHIPSLKTILPEFRGSGIRIPDDGILLRKRTPTGASEVRYYHPEDEKLAEAVKRELAKLAGVEARVSRVNDDTAPLKMIQISFSVQDTEKASVFINARGETHQ